MAIRPISTMTYTDALTELKHARAAIIMNHKHITEWVDLSIQARAVINDHEHTIAKLREQLAQYAAINDDASTCGLRRFT